MVPMTPPTFVDIVPGRVAYAEGFLSSEDSLRLRTDIAATSPWTQERLRVAGEQIPFPRLVSWHGDPGITYRYSGIEHPAQVWTPPLLEVRDRLLVGFPKLPLNGVLLNRYRSGQDSIGRHADREDDLVPGAPIIGISLGGTRTIRFRPMGGSAKTEIKLPLRDGSLLLMFGDCQKTWTHEIKKEPSADAERISLTFRCVKPPIAADF